MGFYMYITCSLEICKDTGKHFYYKGFEKIYDMPPIVPEKYRDFVKMRGNVFESYARLITDETNTSIENFIDKYPEWFDIVDNSDVNDLGNFWNENKHNQFYAALKWFSEQNSSYTVSWTD